MSAEPTRAEVDAYVDEVWDDVIRDIDYLVQVESVEDLAHADEEKPFGPGPYEALKRALEVAGRLGLEPHNCGGHIGYADLPGASDKQIATIAHTDIVPLGTGWHTDPLHVTRKEGYLLGRGVLDDKGPFTLSLYAAHFFARKEQLSGEQIPYTLRCLVGVNEETNMEDVEWYLAHYPEPDFLFTPDADFPLICGEKGLYGCAFTTAPVAQRIVSFDAGTASNAIPGVAELVLKADADKLPAAEGIAIEPAGEGLAKLTAHGKGGHASMPEGTKNAIGMLVSYLLANDLVEGDERNFFELEQKIFAASDGSGMGIATSDEKFGALTSCGGVIHLKDGRYSQTLDCRYPTSVTGEELDSKLETLAKSFGVTFHPERKVEPFYTDPNSAEIQTLVKTYNEFTGHDDRPFTIGGGTYARHFKNACAFGPHDSRMETPEWVGIEHGPDEGILEDQLKLALKIYIVSIARLMNLDL